LSLVQQLVTLHRGEISAFSAGEPGKGSEFVVSLPVIATPAN
jgi:signal transduction histidine kinase